jgi:hypothetical protein
LNRVTGYSHRNGGRSHLKDKSVIITMNIKGTIMVTRTGVNWLRAAPCSKNRTWSFAKKCLYHTQIQVFRVVMPCRVAVP